MTPDKVFDLAEGLTDFFGVPPNKVNHFVRYIALNLDYRPEWLKGKPTLRDLPRFGKASAYRIPVPRRKQRLLAQDIVWIVENLKHRWVLKEDGFQFENLADATMFKLRV